MVPPVKDTLQRSRRIRSAAVASSALSVLLLLDLTGISVPYAATLLLPLRDLELPVLEGAMALTGLLWAVWVIYRPTDSKKLPAHPAAAPRPAEKSLMDELDKFGEDGGLSDEDVDRIIRHSLHVRAIVRAIERAAFSFVALWVCLTVLSNLDQLVPWGLTIILWVLLFVELNQKATVVMGALYATIVGVSALVYALPYRAARKELLVSDEGRTKSLGRVLSIRGEDHRGRPPRTWRYSLWLTYRSLRGDKRPNPNEYPFGDPYYLLADKKRRTPSFRWCIVYQSNTLGIIARRLPSRLKRLYGRGNLTISAFAVRVSGDGFILRPYPRSVPEAPPHDELSFDELTYHARQIEPYKDQGEITLKFAAKVVRYSVGSDPEVGKEQARRFKTPGGLKVLGVIQDETVKREEPKDAAKPADHKA